MRPIANITCRPLLSETIDEAISEHPFINILEERLNEGIDEELDTAGDCIAPLFAR